MSVWLYPIVRVPRTRVERCLGRTPRSAENVQTTLTPSRQCPNLPEQIRTRFRPDERGLYCRIEGLRSVPSQDLCGRSRLARWDRRRDDHRELALLFRCHVIGPSAYPRSPRNDMAAFPSSPTARTQRVHRLHACNGIPMLPLPLLLPHCHDDQIPIVQIHTRQARSVVHHFTLVIQPQPRYR